MHPVMQAALESGGAHACISYRQHRKTCAASSFPCLNDTRGCPEAGTPTCTSGRLGRHRQTGANASQARAWSKTSAPGATFAYPGGECTRRTPGVAMHGSSFSRKLSSATCTPVSPRQAVHAIPNSKPILRCPRPRVVRKRPAARAAGSEGGLRAAAPGRRPARPRRATRRPGRPWGRAGAARGSARRPCRGRRAPPTRAPRRRRTAARRGPARPPARRGPHPWRRAGGVVWLRCWACSAVRPSAAWRRLPDRHAV